MLISKGNPMLMGAADIRMDIILHMSQNAKMQLC